MPSAPVIATWRREDSQRPDPRAGDRLRPSSTTRPLIRGPALATGGGAGAVRATWTSAAGGGASCRDDHSQPTPASPARVPERKSPAATTFSRPTNIMAIAPLHQRRHRRRGDRADRPARGQARGGPGGRLDPRLRGRLGDRAEQAQVRTRGRRQAAAGQPMPQPLAALPPAGAAPCGPAGPAGPPPARWSGPPGGTARSATGTAPAAGPAPRRRPNGSRATCRIRRPAPSSRPPVARSPACGPLCARAFAATFSATPKSQLASESARRIEPARLARIRNVACAASSASCRSPSAAGRRPGPSVRAAPPAPRTPTRSRRRPDRPGTAPAAGRRTASRPPRLEDGAQMPRCPDSMLAHDRHLVPLSPGPRIGLNLSLWCRPRRGDRQFSFDELNFWPQRSVKRCTH